jgi:hypothetical protein
MAVGSGYKYVQIFTATPLSMRIYSVQNYVYVDTTVWTFVVLVCTFVK